MNNRLFKIGVVMGSKSDWNIMEFAANTLSELEINYDVEIVSAHRTPDKLFDYACKARDAGIAVIIAGAGGAAHLPGMLASKTDLPVLGVPILSESLRGLDSLLSIVQMPAGIPVGTLAIGKSGAINAAILAASILSIHSECILENLRLYRLRQTEAVLSSPDPRVV